MVTNDAKLQKEGKPTAAGRTTISGCTICTPGTAPPGHTAAACSYSYQRPINTARFSHSRLGLANQHPGFVPVERRVSASRSTRRGPSKQRQRKEKKRKQAARTRRWPCGGSCARRPAGRKEPRPTRPCCWFVHASGRGVSFSFLQRRCIHLSVRPSHPPTTSHPLRAAATKPLLWQLASRPWPVDGHRTPPRHRVM